MDEERRKCVGIVTNKQYLRKKKLKFTANFENLNH